MASINNVTLLSELMEKYPKQIEIKHVIHPLRGFVLDDHFVRLKDEKNSSSYKEGELNNNQKTFYKFEDSEWVDWLQKVFWNLYRGAPSAEKRMKELEKIF